MPLLIDPPVGPYSKPAAIRAWLEQLEQLRREHAGDADAVRSIDRERERAQAWLEQASG